MMKKSIFIKMISGFLIPIIILPLLIILLTFNFLKENYINDVYNNTYEVALLIRHNLNKISSENKYSRYNDWINSLSKEIDKRVTLIDIDGKIIIDSNKNMYDRANQKKQKEFIEAKESGLGKSIRFDEKINEEIFFVAIPISPTPYNTEESAILRVGTSLNDKNNFIRDIEIRILSITSIIIFIFLIIVIFFYKKLSNPINELVSVSRKVASGDFDTKVLIKNKDELGELAYNFNYMVSHIKELFENLSSQKNKIDTIIESFYIALFVLDRDGRFVMSNKSFRSLVKKDDVDNKYYWEILREFELSKILKKVKEKNNLITELQLLDKIFLCNACYLNATQESVVILSDITEIRNLEKMKKDFVVNVSHELRTPLTAIKGFVETLMEDGNMSGDNQHYLSIIKRHTDRLSNIVSDLLLLSELEDTANNINFSFDDVDLKSLILDTVKIFEYKLKEKNLELKYSLNDVSCIQADSFALEQVVVNLMSNAIRYTEKGHIKIELRETKNSSIEFTVRDTGIGIKEEETDRIFERFYVVNKSRSRMTGGTGLGLSIVKHIVHMHNGNISVESKFGKGTEFTIELPIKNSK